MRADILLIARIFPRPYGARKNTTQLAKYPRVLYAKPLNKVYVFQGVINTSVSNRTGTPSVGMSVKGYRFLSKVYERGTVSVKHGS